MGPLPGFIAPELAAEHPGLRLAHLTMPARRAPSPPPLRRQLERLSDRAGGASVITMRTKAIPQAYRAFHHQIGLDPDVQRTPAERVAAERLLYGGYRSQDVIADACLVALIETGVPVWALDAAAIDRTPPGLGIRIMGAALVIADARQLHATLFDDPLPGHGPARATTAVTLFAIAVPGVPEIHLQEALWLAGAPLGAWPER